MKKAKEKFKFFSFEMLGMLLVLISILGLLCLIGGEYLFGVVGLKIKGFFLGVFGYMAYAVLLCASLYGILSVAGVEFKKKPRFKTVLLFTLFILSACSLVHLLTVSFTGNYGSYLSKTYRLGFGKMSKVSAGGVILSLVVGLLATFVKTIGCYLIFGSILVAISALFIIKRVRLAKNGDSVGNDNGKYSLPFGGADLKQNPVQNYSMPFGQNNYSSQNGYNNSQGNVNGGYSAPFYTAPANNGYGDYSSRLNQGEERETQNYKPSYSTDFAYGDFAKDQDKSERQFTYQGNVKNEYEKSQSYDFSQDTQDYSSNRFDSIYENSVGDKSEADPQTFVFSTESSEDKTKEQPSFESVKVDYDQGDFEKETVDYSTKVSDPVGKADEDPFKDRRISTTFGSTSFMGGSFKSESVSERREPVVNEKKEDDSVLAYIDDYQFTPPPLTILHSYEEDEDKYELQRFYDECKNTISEVIFKMKGKEMHVSEIFHGPTVTRFDLPVPRDISVNTVMGVETDMALQLGVDTSVRIVPVPKSACLGVEVPNRHRSKVGLRELLESEEFKNANAEDIPFVVGKDTIGKCLIMDLADLTHVLIAGGSGSGKSVFIRSLLLSIMYKCSPKDIRFIICDPKAVDFTAFGDCPHLLIDEVVTDKPKIAKTLDWVIKEMERRYAKLSELRASNIASYNKKCETKDKMYRILVLIDEFADLVSVDKTILTKTQVLAQKARACGIHLFIATQRTSVEIISGDIKTNFDTRISLRMQNIHDSKTIIETTGAESLLKHGDMLFYSPIFPTLTRAQGPLVTEEELDDIAEFLRKKNKHIFDKNLKKYINASAPIPSYGGSDDDFPDNESVDMDFKIKVLRYVVGQGTVSASGLQRQFSVGYNRAARVVDWMKENGYVVNSEKGNRLEVKITKEEIEEKYGA